MPLDANISPNRKRDRGPCTLNPLEETGIGAKNGLETARGFDQLHQHAEPVKAAGAMKLRGIQVPTQSSQHDKNAQVDRGGTSVSEVSHFLLGPVLVVSQHFSSCHASV